MLQKENYGEIFEITAICYEKLEIAESIINLLSEKSGDRDTQIALKMVLSNLYHVTERILKIQELQMASGRD